MPTLSRRAIDRFVAGHATAARVLDLGCGQGPYARHFPGRIGCDIKASPAVHVVADAHATPFRAGTFEVVLCSEVLEHLREPERAIAEMYRVLRPSGKLVLTTRFLYPIHDNPHDYWRFTRGSLVHLLRKWHLELLEEDVSEILTARQLAEFALRTWPRWARWPAKAVIRALAWPAELISVRWSRKCESRTMSSGYLVVARKPASNPLRCADVGPMV